jgi:hypothetical protein
MGATCGAYIVYPSGAPSNIRGARELKGLNRITRIRKV